MVPRPLLSKSIPLVTQTLPKKIYSPQPQIALESLLMHQTIKPLLLLLIVFPRPPQNPVLGEFSVQLDPKDEQDNTVHLDSVLRKRRLKMKKHKLRKRRKRQRSLKIRLGKI